MAGTRIASVSGLRGIVGDGLDPASVSEFSAAYASLCEPGPILVAHDGRASAPVFVQAVQAGITATGHDVLFAGAAATPTVGLLVRERGFSGAVQVSASHNPPEYNGLKFFQKAGMVLSASSGRDLLDRFERKDFAWAPWHALGRVRTLDDPDREHLDRVLAIVDVEAIRRQSFRVVLDACHGAGGRAGSALLRALGCQAVVLGTEPDGLYDHPPEPTEANLSAFSTIVPAVGAVVGFAQDPDADRLAIVDERGRYIGEERTLALAALNRLDQQSGPVVLNLSTSKITEDLALARGCSVERTAVGEINVVEKMLASRAVLGGEGNGGVIDPRVGFVRDSLAAMALVLDLLARSRQPVSSLVASLPSYSMAKTKFPVAGVSVNEVFERIQHAHPDARSNRVDGLRLDWPDRWVHVRSSNTEPIVRVIAEAPDDATARALAESVGKLVTGGG